MRGLAIAVAALVAVCSIHSAAEAQCAPGRVISEDTQGRCCWPAQTWDGAAARCEGLPACPSGWGAHGNECVRIEPERAPSLATTTPSAEEPVPADAPPPAAAPTAANAGGVPWWAERRGWEPRPTHEERQPIRGLWVTGTIILSLAYTYSLVIGSIWLSSGSCSEQNSWTNYIPFIGGFIWAGVHEESCGYYSNSALGEALGIPSSVLQLSGLVLLIIGLAARRSVQVPDRETSGRGGVRLAGGPGDVGLGLAVDF